MMFYVLILQFYLKNGQRKKNDTFLKKKSDEQQNSATTMIYIDGKGTIFSTKLKLHGESLEEKFN